MKDQLLGHLKEWMNQEGHKFHFLDELLEEAMRLKAQVVYKKCIKAGKINWALKIMKKYSLPVPYSDDMVTAFGLAMINAKNK